MRRRVSLQKRRFARRLAGYATNPLRRRVRVTLGREQAYSINGFPVSLPPAHDLPFYQRRDPTYDSYAIAVLSDLARGRERTVVIDIGANVGDTAVAALSAADSISVISVEGASTFLPYLRSNLRQFGERARTVEAFVGPIGTDVTYSDDGSTGGFQTAVRQNPTGVTEWVSPETLLDMAAGADQIVWKSDIDGFDIHVLVQHWEPIDSRCAAIWFEFDPASTLGDPADVVRLIDLISASGRTVWIYDNLGRRMADLPAGDAIRHGLEGLAGWMREQRNGHLSVPYVDVWAVREPASSGGPAT